MATEMKKPSALLPKLKPAEILRGEVRRAFIGAYGFEERSTAWLSRQCNEQVLLKGSTAYFVRYDHPKGKNRVGGARRLAKQLGLVRRPDIHCDLIIPGQVESAIQESELFATINTYDEVIVDVSSMTKLLILVLLVLLRDYKGRLRVVYAEAVSYGPTRKQYESHACGMRMLAGFPSLGASDVVSQQCLSSIRMLGQPVTLMTFLSFNEQLIRHLVGSVSPHRLIAINGIPPRRGNHWRQDAMQEIHRQIVSEYAGNNPMTAEGKLMYAISTLDYRLTLDFLEESYLKYGLTDRIIVGATGSKMQTVGTAFFKLLRPDVHIDYPLPDSYFPGSLSHGVRGVWEIEFDDYSGTSQKLVDWENEQS